MDGTTIEAETAVPLAGESFPAITGTVSSIGDIFSPSGGKISSSGGELFSQRVSSTKRYSWIGAKKHLSLCQYSGDIAQYSGRLLRFTDASTDGFVVAGS